MADVEFLKYCLEELFNQYSSKEIKDTIETLLIIHRNILDDEDNLRFRKLKPANQRFSRTVWNYEPARDFMHSCGWIEVEDFLVFNSDEKLVDIIQVLLDYRLLTVPDAAEWKEETKCENLNYSKEREDELRRKAALQREKELQEYQKEKMYRQKLNEEVKAKIAEDREKNRNTFTKPVVGNKLDRYGKFKQISSLNPHLDSESSDEEL